MDEQVQLQSQAKAVNQCPVCASVSLQDVLKLTQLPLLSNVLWDTRQEALAAPRGDVRLVFCPACGHVFNQEYDPARLEYDVQYENSLHFSPRFQEYAAWLARYLVDRYNLRGKHIIEIGSGKGEFLRLLCEYGGNTGTGFDPSYNPLHAEAHPALSFVKDVYSERYAGHRADFILSRHVLEHIHQPAQFVQVLRRTIGSHRQTGVYFEVPNLGYILHDTAVWDIIYEHYSYFSASSLANLFTRAGFEPLQLAEAYEGQFLYIEAMPRDSDQPSPGAPDATALEALANQVSDFTRRSQDKLERWSAQVEGLLHSGKRAVIWGAGSKGISFLNMLHIQDRIEYVIDINPRKRGKYITGSGQQIVPPEFLQRYRPETVIVMNPIYRAEIEKTVQSLGFEVEYLYAS